MRSASSLVFACHSKACAPPPVGQGGSKAGSVVPPMSKRVAKVIAKERERMHKPLSKREIRKRAKTAERVQKIIEKERRNTTYD